MSVKLKRYLAIITATIGAVLLYVFARRGQTIADLRDQLVVNKIGAELEAITIQSKKSDANYAESKRRYDALKLAHPEYFKSGPQG